MGSLVVSQTKAIRETLKVGSLVVSQTSAIHQLQEQYTQMVNDVHQRVEGRPVGFVKGVNEPRRFCMPKAGIKEVVLQAIKSGCHVAFCSIGGLEPLALVEGKWETVLRNIKMGVQKRCVLFSGERRAW